MKTPSKKARRLPHRQAKTTTERRLTGKGHKKRTGSHVRSFFFWGGGPGRLRTYDNPVMSRGLYQLSYGSNSGNIPRLPRLGKGKGTYFKKTIPLGISARRKEGVPGSLQRRRTAFMRLHAPQRRPSCARFGGTPEEDEMLPPPQATGMTQPCRSSRSQRNQSARADASSCAPRPEDTSRAQRRCSDRALPSWQGAPLRSLRRVPSSTPGSLPLRQPENAKSPLPQSGRGQSFNPAGGVPFRAHHAGEGLRAAHAASAQATPRSPRPVQRLREPGSIRADGRRPGRIRELQGLHAHSRSSGSATRGACRT